MSAEENSGSTQSFSPEAQKIIDNLNRQIEESKLEKQQLKIKFEEAKIKIEQKLEEQKESIKEEARQELLSKLKQDKAALDEAQKKIDDELREKIIKKIQKFQENANVSELRKMSIPEIKSYYLGVINVEVAERKKEYTVTCPKCKLFLGKTTTHDKGVALYKEHRASCTKIKNSNLGKWLLLGIVLSGLALGLGLASQNKKRKTNDTDKTS